MIPIHVSVCGNEWLLFSATETQKPYGMTMGLSQISRYVPMLSGPLIVTDAVKPFTMRFPCADIHELLTCDLLHQVIKGTFKDHLVEWVEDYLKKAHGPSKANAILDNIDWRYVKYVLDPCDRAQCSTVLCLHLSFLASRGSNKATTSNSGPVMTQRLS